MPIEAVPTSPSATLMLAPQKGRGTVWAIEHRFGSQSRDEFDDGWGTLEQAAHEERSAPGTRVLDEEVRTILTGNDSPDIGFDLSIAYSTSSRTPFRSDGGQHSTVMADTVPR